jgi:hypothetical protein
LDTVAGKASFRVFLIAAGFRVFLITAGLTTNLRIMAHTPDAPEKQVLDQQQEADHQDHECGFH